MCLVLRTTSDNNQSAILVHLILFTTVSTRQKKTGFSKKKLGSKLGSWVVSWVVNFSLKTLRFSNLVHAQLCWIVNFTVKTLRFFQLWVINFTQLVTTQLWLGSEFN